MAFAQGREPFIGVAVENTAGTPKTAVKYLPFVTCTIRGIHEPMEDDAAKGVRERVWGAITGRKRGEGDVEIYVDVENAAYLLYPALGSISSALATGESVVYRHVITRKSGSTPKTLTVTYNDTQDTRVFPYATMNTLELSVSDGLATVSANILSKFPETTSSTASQSITEERILAFKDYKVRFGSGATGAAALADAATNQPTLLRSFNLRVNNNAEAVYQSGEASAQDITVSEFEVDGDYTLFFQNTVDRSHYETMFSDGNKARAMIVTFTGDAIGTTGGANTEEIEIKIPNFHLTDRTIDTAISGFITENPSFFAQYDPSVQKSIEVKITNRTASY